MTSTRVLFINPPLVTNWDFIDYPWFANYGLLAAAGKALKASAVVSVVDSFAMKDSLAGPHQQGRWFGASLASVLNALPHETFDSVVVGFSPFLTAWQPDQSTVLLVSELRKCYPQAAIVGCDCHIGGMHYIDYDATKALQSLPELDAIIKYGGDDYMSAPERLVELKGSRAVLESPNLGADAAFPAFELIDVRHYGAFLWRVFADGNLVNTFGIDAATRPLLTSFGCPHRCVFCSSNPGWRVSGKKQFFYPPIDQIKSWAYLLAKGFGAKKLFVMDDVANARPDFAAMLVELNKLNLLYEFPNGLRADRLTKEIIDLMKGRISVLSLSAESANAEQLEGPIGKRQNPAAVAQAAKWALEAGIPVMVHYIIGFPWETPADVNATLEMAWELFEKYEAFPAVQYATPLPGTKLWTMCQELGLPFNADGGARFQHEPSFVPPGIPDGWLQKAKGALDLKLHAASQRKVIINITYECINHCLFCAVGNRVRKGISFPRLQEILKEHRAKGIEALDIDGGEPTLHPDLYKTLEYAKELGYRRINVTTNGRRLKDPAEARQLLATGITSMSISLHGDTAQLHDLLTGVPGSFDETIHGIQNCLNNLGIGQDFAVNVTVVRQNVEHLLSLVSLIYGMGVRKVNIQFLTPFGNAQRNLLPGQDMTPVIQVLDKFGDKMAINVVNGLFCQLPGYESFLAGDVQKLGRTMVFVTDEEVNLFDYLGARRHKKEVCKSCAWSVVCEGFFEFQEGPSDV
ncbi:MAG TPA: radical SAM protein [Myxococcota bacterium]|nr:radical SAM protein [Myxococcota bacterium]HOS61984.1 radical SAM protein [Myxococcota bacterium]HPC91692.1 radical SAM protein [Myxococcota bacterium]HPL25599.1 radical SAM protein [Myxococcota bacterium]HQE73445.1 radical SAM protein [Myxococcota bacterium]